MNSQAEKTDYKWKYGPNQYGYNWSRCIMSSQPTFHSMLSTKAMREAQKK